MADYVLHVENVLCEQHYQTGATNQARHTTFLPDFSVPEGSRISLECAMWPVATLNAASGGWQQARAALSVSGA